MHNMHHTYARKWHDVIYENENNEPPDAAGPTDDRWYTLLFFLIFSLEIDDRRIQSLPERTKHLVV